MLYLFVQKLFLTVSFATLLYAFSVVLQLLLGLSAPNPTTIAERNAKTERLHKNHSNAIGSAITSVVAMCLYAQM